MKKIMHMGIFLAILASVAATALTVVNNITAPIIIEAQNVFLFEQLRAAFPESTQQTPLGAPDASDPYTLNVFRATDANGATLGYIYLQETMGFNGVVRYLVSVDTNGYVRNFQNVLNSETPEFAAPPQLSAWANNNFLNSPLTPDIDIMAGSTVTTAPIVRGMGHIYQDFQNR